MSGANRQKGLRHEEMRERLRLLGLKARQDPRSLSLKEIDEICLLVVKLGPTRPILPDLRALQSAAFSSSFTPITPDDGPRIETQALLRQTHAMEYIAYQLGELVRLKEEEAVRERWKTEYLGDWPK